MISSHITLASVKLSKEGYGIFYALREYLLHSLAYYVMGWNKSEM